MAQIQDRIEKTYHELAVRQGPEASSVGLADVRDRVGPDVSAADFDQAIIDMSYRPDVMVPPENNQKTLTPRDRAAVVSIGNQDRHLLRISGPPAGGARPKGEGGAAATIGRVARGPTRLQVALGDADVPSRGRDFGDHDLAGPDGVVLHRGVPLPADFSGTRDDIYAGRFAQRPGLTSEESRALDLYVLSSVADPLNAALRAGGPASGTARTRVRAPGGGHLAVDLADVGAQLDSAIASSELGSDTNLYRGALMRPYDVGKLQPGAEFAEPGYLSTTTSRMSAHSIIGWRAGKASTRGKSRVLFVIRAPAGTHAAVGHVEENEALLGRGRKMRVVDVLTPTRSGDTRVVTVELLPEGDTTPTTVSNPLDEGRGTLSAIRSSAQDWEPDADGRDAEGPMEDDAKAKAVRRRQMALLDSRALGHDVTPGNDRLHHWWTRGPGLKLWIGSPHQYTTLHAELVKATKGKLPPGEIDRMAASWVHEVTGFWPGSDMHRVLEGGKPRGNKIGRG
jgi:hypothetical protein